MHRKNRNKLTDLRYRFKFYITVAAVYTAATPFIVHADLNSTCNVVIEAIFPFIYRFGILLTAFGAIEFAVAQQAEDAAQKIRAARFMLAGVITISVIDIVKPYLLF